MFCTFYFLKQKTVQLITGDCSWSLLHDFKIGNKSCPLKPMVLAARSQAYQDL